MSNVAEPIARGKSGIHRTGPLLWVLLLSLCIGGTALGHAVWPEWRAPFALTVVPLFLVGLFGMFGFFKLRTAIARQASVGTGEDELARWVTTRSGSILAGADGKWSPLGNYVADQAREEARLLADAANQGRASRTIVRADGTLRAEVSALGFGLFLWNLREVKASSFPLGDFAFDALAVLMFGGGEDAVFANGPAHRIFGGDFPSRRALEESVDAPKIFQTADGPGQFLVSKAASAQGRCAYFCLPISPGDTRSDAVKFDALPVALLKVSPTGEVDSGNQAARLLLGNQLTPRCQLHDLMEGLGRSINDWLAEAAAGLGNNHSEFLLLKRSDREVFVQVSLSRVVQRDGVALIAVLTDATELKSLEAQFVQSQKMQAIGQLAGGVAHDFNNLLTAITGHCDLLLLRHDQSDPDFADLVQINQNANRAAALVGQLLAFSRKQNLRPEVLDLRDTLADLTHLLNRLVGERVSLSLVHDPNLKPVRADKRQLEQVLMNLVVNARDAMPDGGEIVIETESTLLTDPLIRDRATVPAGSYVSVRVKDQGIGINPDKIQKVFEPFYTTKRTGEGTGLGLSTAYGIVKQTGGYIFVDSVPGEGTCFSLLFPAHEVYDSVQPRDVVAAEKPSVSVDGGIVLLVEDEAPVRSFASRALRLKGFTVLEAASGEEALETLEDPQLGVDLFVSDVVMPGMDGPSWVTAAHERRPGIPVIFMSGYAEDSFSDTQARIPNASFLPKPFSLRELTDTVQEKLARA